jgi:hypothetical protein
MTFDKIARDLAELQKAVNSPAMRMAMDAKRQHEQLMKKMRPTLELAAKAAAAQMPRTQPMEIRVPVPRETYIIKAQQETTDAVESLSELVQQTVEIQGKQIDALITMQGSMDAQTRLTRWVLGVSVGALFVGIGGLATTIAGLI